MNKETENKELKKAIRDIMYITDPLGHFGHERAHKIACDAIKVTTDYSNTVCAKCGGSGYIGNGPTSFNTQRCDCPIGVALTSHKTANQETDLPEEKKQAIRPEELRIGNWLYNSEFEGNTQIYAHGIAKIAQFKDHPYSAIPLSPEWLERLGFVSKDNDDIYHIQLSNMGKLYVSSLLTKPTFEVGNFREGICAVRGPINHVHQLMNIYFALTGQELKLVGGCLLK